MLEGMYSAAAGMAAQQQRLDALSNDIANVGTVGYKRLRVAFRDLVYNASGPGARPGISEGAGVSATVIGRGGAGAALKKTEQPLDVAITGPGFLQVTRPGGGQALTRNGSLTMDSQRRLLADGLPLQPPVRIPAGVDATKTTIEPDGTVSFQGRVLGRLPLFAVQSPERLQSIGGNLHLPTAASGPAVRATAATTVTQGMLETSDVDTSDAMTDMLDAQRSYALASKAISMQDQMAQIANGVKK